MTKRPRRRQRGFTLIEVLLVLAILVILGSMVGVFIMRAQDTAYEDSALSQIKMFEGPMEWYRLDVGAYPNPSQGGLTSLKQPPTDGASQKWRGPYMKEIPIDPWGQPYQYELGSDGRSFRIWSTGPDRANNTDDDIPNAAQRAEATSG